VPPFNDIFEKTISVPKNGFSPVHFDCPLLQKHHNVLLAFEFANWLPISIPGGIFTALMTLPEAKFTGRSYVHQKNCSIFDCFAELLELSVPPKIAEKKSPISIFI